MKDRITQTGHILSPGIITASIISNQSTLDNDHLRTE